MRIAVLGPLLVQGDDGALVAVPGAKERLLLATLAAGAPRVVSTDRIIDVLWDGDAPPSARKSLQAHVVRLRSALEPGRPRGSPGRYVVRRGSGYTLAVGRDALDSLLATDLATRGRALLAAGDASQAARVLTEALDLWRGEPYGDWPDGAFAEAERRRLVEVRSAAATALLEARLALGEQAEVVAEVERLLTEDPLREEWWGLLVLALYRGGRQGDALAAAQRARRVLADELGADPGPALRQVEAAVLRQDPALDPPGRPPGGPADGAPAAGFPSVPAHPAACPYKGLAVYEPADAALFRGRAALVNRLVARLVDAPLLAVSGPSGAGKSSAVRAGLVPALAGGALPGSRDWLSVVVTPGRHPVDVLADLSGEVPPQQPVVLVVDQCEELWSPSADGAERSAFLDAVLGLLGDGVVVRCVLVVRGDSVGRLAEHAGITERLGSAVVLVPALTEAELREVLVEPAAAVGLTVEQELVDAVVADVLGRPGALPLLSTALVGTWERRRGDRLTLAGYVEAGGVSGALAATAEAAFAELDEPEQAVARRLLVRLADTDQGGALVRRPVPLVELALDGPSGRSRRAVVDAFVRRRLLSIDRERLDVAHESLLTAWPRLARWLDEDAAGRAVRRHLSPAAREWERQGRPDDELYRGARLTAALDWAVGDRADLTDVERSFLDASKRRSEAELLDAREQVTRERRARHRTRRLAAGLAVVLVLALVAGGLALVYQRAADARADEAERLALVADANRLAAVSASGGPLDVSLLLAVQAARFARTPETEDALLAMLAGRQRAVAVAAIDPDVRDSTFGGSTLFMDDGVALSAWSAAPLAAPRAAPRRVGTWGRWLVADGSPTDDLLVGAGADPSGRMWVRLLDAAGRTVELVRAGESEGRPLGVSFTADGQRVLLLVATGASADGLRWRVIEFDPVTGTGKDTGLTGVLPGPAESPAADISEDARTAVLVDDAGSPSAATLVDLVDGRQVALQLPDRPATGSGLRALADGAAQTWADGGLTLYGLDGRAHSPIGTGRDAVLDVAVAPDGSWAATVGARGVITLWDVDRASGHWTSRESFVGHAGDVRNAEVSGDGTVLVTVGADDRAVAWAATPGGAFGTPVSGTVDRRFLRPPEVVDPSRLVVAVTVPTGGAAADGPVPVSMTFLDPSTGQVVGEVAMGSVDAVGSGERPSVAVSPDRRRVAGTDGSTVTVLDSRTQRPLAGFAAPSTVAAGPTGELMRVAGTSCLGWTPDGARLLLCARGNPGSVPPGALVAVDPSSGEVLGQGRYLGLFDSLTPTRNGQLLLSDVPLSRVLVLEPDTLLPVQVFPVGEGAGNTDLSVSADGRRLAVTGRSGRLFLYDIASGAPGPPVTFGTTLLQAEWLPDGRTVAVAGTDGTVALYDAERRQLRSPPMSAAQGRAADVHLLPGVSEELVALTGVTSGRRWPLDPEVWVERACAVVGRDLSRAEWDRYLPERPYRPTCSDLR